MIVYYYYLPIYYDSFNISNNFYYLVSFRFFNATLIVAVKYDEDKSRPIYKAEGLIIYLLVIFCKFFDSTQLHLFVCFFVVLLVRLFSCVFNFTFQPPLIYRLRSKFCNIHKYWNVNKNCFSIGVLTQNFLSVILFQNRHKNKSRNVSECLDAFCC